MTFDPALDAIRRARRQISHEADHDAARLVDHYKQMQAAFTGRVILGPEAAPEQRAGLAQVDTRPGSA